MILILSTIEDHDTDLVIEHLNLQGEKYIRLNDIDLFNGKTKVKYIGKISIPQNAENFKDFISIMIENEKYIKEKIRLFN